MAWKEKSSASFTGGSGQMAVMGELLHRKCNVAVPHIDIGTDVFAFKDDRGGVARIQVKTAPGKRYKTRQGYSARFAVPMAQLDRADDPPLFYAFAVRIDGGWGRFVFIGRRELKELWQGGCGSLNENSGQLELHFRFQPGELSEAPQDKNVLRWELVCGEFDLSVYLDGWEILPPLASTPASVPEQLED